MTAMVDSIMQELKSSTQGLHDATEKGRFNKDLVMGRVPLESYVDSLEQLYLVHQALEAKLRENHDSHPAFSAVLRDYQFQEPYLLADIAFFKRDLGSIRALEPTRRFIEAIDRIAKEEPVGLMGIHYVFEGSNNGSRHISTALRRAYGFTGRDGTNYFDPYGDRQHEYWQAFKQDMAAVRLTALERRAMVDAAAAAFQAVMELHAALGENLPEASAAPAPRSGCPFGH
ncbi:MAG TPA: biliverdin-producing heme oxygenase [Phycisphaerae bacterium]|nr:biliverdin-producing heme oxygenase [Phycisphaerae bacterium]